MRITRTRTALAVALLATSMASPALHAQDHTAHAPAAPQQAAAHDDMLQLQLGRGWRLVGMAQVFPILTAGFGAGANESITATELYATQGALMFNILSPGSRAVLRTTLNVEGLTQPGGELTSGAWGEGFLDRRHPHTLLHELMLSINVPDALGGALSFSAGRGFAPYGTDDPMSRPVAKYPTNHHLSQVLERYTVSTAFVRGPWSLEAGVFAGTEPTGPYDFSNYGGFPDSWSARVTRRLPGASATAAWELSASYARVTERHDAEERVTGMVNAFVRHERQYRAGRVYALIEASRSDPADDHEDGFYAVLAEAQLTRGRHRPYARVELATRPEYVREGEPGSSGFYRYDHDAHPIAATRWLITSVGYGYAATALPASVRPFLEVQYNNAANERGAVSATELFGTTRFWSLTAGARILLGGEPMRMGSYGVLDAMTVHAAPGHEHHEH